MRNLASSNEKERVVIKSFPADRRDALTMLYMQNQDLSGKTPEELASMYSDTYDLISEKFLDIKRRKAAEHG